MDKSTKNKLWLLVIIAFVIIGMLLAIVFNQAIPFISSKKEETKNNTVIELDDKAEGYTYLGKEEASKSNLLSKDEMKKQLDIGRFSNNISIKKYLTGISNIDLLNNYLMEPVDEKSILSVLDENYKTDKNINSSNVKELVGEYTFIPIGTSAFAKNDNVETFIYYGYRVNETEKAASEYGYLVTFNYVAETFSLAPYEFQELKSILSKKETITNKNIVLNEYNRLIITDDSAERCASETLKLFKYNAKFLPELAFSELDTEYSNKFGSAKAFSKYIENNEERFDAIAVDKSIQKKSDGKITYTCTDKKQNVFYITSSENDFFDFKIKFSNIIL